MKKHESQKKYLEELLMVLQKAATSKKLLELFLKDLLTPLELEEISLRWQIVKELSQDTPQRDIVEKLKVGVGTVTRGSRMLLNKEGGFNQLLRKQ